MATPLAQLAPTFDEMLHPGGNRQSAFVELQGMPTCSTVTCSACRLGAMRKLLDLKSGFGLLAMRHVAFSARSGQGLSIGRGLFHIA